ncbi:MAG: P27 family phage terminase small subunit [Pseudomonadota bacterium]
MQSDNVRSLGLPDRYPREPLSLPPAGRALWRQMIASLIDEGLFKIGRDEAAFQMGCQAWAEYLQCNEVLEADGLTVKGEGLIQTRAHPMLRVREASLKQLRIFQDQFLAAPLIRKRLREDQQGDLFEQIEKVLNGDTSAA